MTWLPLLPFTLFAGCCVAQFWFGPKVVSALVARHPETYRRMRGLSLPNKLFWFALFRRDRGLDDADLTIHTKRLQVLSSAALAAWLMFIVLIITVQT